jgi:hypothetical protein
LVSFEIAHAPQINTFDKKATNFQEQRLHRARKLFNENMSIYEPQAQQERALTKQKKNPCWAGFACTYGKSKVIFPIKSPEQVAYCSIRLREDTYLNCYREMNKRRQVHLD